MDQVEPRAVLFLCLWRLRGVVPECRDLSPAQWDERGESTESVSSVRDSIEVVSEPSHRELVAASRSVSCLSNRYLVPVPTRRIARRGDDCRAGGLAVPRTSGAVLECGRQRLVAGAELHRELACIHLLGICAAGVAGDVGD